MTETTFLIEAKPWDPVAAAIVTRRFSLRARDKLYDGELWRAAIAAAFRYEVTVLGPGGNSSPAVGAVTVTIPKVDDLTDLNWEGREIVFHRGAPDDAFGAFVVAFKGTIEAVTWRRGKFTIALRDASHLLDAPLQTETYAGTGDVEGGSDVKGRKKPIAYGPNLNIAPVLLDSVLWIYGFGSGGAAQSVEAVKDRLQGKNAIGDITTLSLATLTAWAPAGPTELGGYITDLANSSFRLGAGPDGPVTADVTGLAQDKTADIVEHAATSFGPFVAGDIDSAAVSAMNTARPWRVGVYLPDPDLTISRFIEMMIADPRTGIDAWWALTPQRKLTMGIRAIATPALTIKAHQVAKIERRPGPRAAHEVRVGYARANRVMDKSEINFPVLLEERAEKRAPLLFWKLNERPSDGAVDNHMIRFFGADKDGDPDVATTAKVLKSDGTLFEFGGTADDGESSLQSPLEAGLCAFVVLETDGSKPFTHGFGPARHAALARKKEGVWQYKRRDAA